MLTIMSLVLMFLALVMMVISYQWRKPHLSIGAAMCWVLASLIHYNLSTAAWDIYYGVFWFAIAMGIVSIMETLYVVRTNKAQEKDDIDTKEEYSMDEYRETMQKHRESLGEPKKKERRSDYENTGRY